MTTTRLVLDQSFRFIDDALQGDLLALVRPSGVVHAVGADGSLLYASADEEVIGNELICSIRDHIFPEWGHFTLEGCEEPRPLTTARYRAYMTEQGIPFVEEVIDGFVWFVIPSDQDSFDWPVAYGEEAEPGAAAVSEGLTGS